MWRSPSLTGRSALVTGASGGIGRALAVRLAQEGVDCVLLARRKDQLLATASAVEASDARALPVVGDVCLPDDRHRALQIAQETLGGLDLLINNAGVSAHGRFHESGPERLRKIMEVNLFAAAELIREATPQLRQSEAGCVANVGSILGWRGAPRNAEYCASKFALRGLSEAIRPELARLGVHVLHASPGTVDTEFFDHLVEKREPLPWGERRGAPAELVARRIVRGIARRRCEVAIDWSDWAFVRAARFSPRLMNLVMRRYG